MLQGSAHSSQYVRYMPAGAAGAAGAAAFTTLAPALPDRLLLVRDWQAPASSSGSESDSSGETGGGDSARSSISRGALIYAIVAGPDSRNGQLVVGPLAPDVLAGSIPDAPSAASQGGSSGGDSSEAGGGGGAGEGDGRALDEGESAGSGLVLLQAHSRDVELVDLVVTSTHLAVLERRNGTLRALSYALPADGASRGGSPAPPVCCCRCRIAPAFERRPFLSSLALQARRSLSCQRGGSMCGRTHPTPSPSRAASRAPLTAHCCACGTAGGREDAAWAVHDSCAWSHALQLLCLPAPAGLPDHLASASSPV